MGGAGTGESTCSTLGELANQVSVQVEPDTMAPLPKTFPGSRDIDAASW